jgi:quercetin dioxygenase-like cupin family protein
VALADTYEMDVFSPIRHDWLNRSDTYFTNQPSQPSGFENPATEDNPARLVRWAEIPKEPLTPMIDRSFVSGERATVCNFLLRQGAIVPSHQHESEQLTWVRRGRLRLTVAGQPFEVGAGSVIRIPSRFPHMAEAIEETEATDLFGPRREDWATGSDQYLRQGNR